MRSTRRFHLPVAVGLAAIAALALAACGPVKKGAPGPHGSETFTCTDGPDTWTVPDGVTHVVVDAYGAQGGDKSTNAGGLGGRATAVIAVVGGETLEVDVGCAGVEAFDTTGADGGFGGGGNGGGSKTGFSGGSGGGGASDVSRNGTPLVVAGGGGGAGSGGAGGGGGGTAGEPGGGGVNPCVGGGGTQTAGGAGGMGDEDGDTGTPGAGGDGGSDAVNNVGGPGGGGGLFGGGGGASEPAGSCPAGGGSGFGPATTVFETGTRTGDGQVVISF